MICFIKLPNRLLNLASAASVAVLKTWCSMLRSNEAGSFRQPNDNHVMTVKKTCCLPI